MIGGDGLLVVSRCRVRAGIVALLVAGGGLGAAASAASSASEALVTPSQARAELTSLWAAREAARSAGDSAALRVIDMGAARDRDIGLISYARGERLPEPWAKRPLGPSVVVVPFQTHYPISFLAFVETREEYAAYTTGPAAQIGFETVMLVVVKSSPSARWRVANESHYGGRFNFTPPASGTYAPPIPAGDTWISPLAALQDLARLDQLEVDHGVSGAMADTSNLFLPGAWTTGNSTPVVDNGRNGLRGQGFKAINTFSVDPSIDGIYQFVGPDSLNVVCGTIRIHAVVTPGQPGGALLQNASRTNWGGFLAPGLYRAIYGQGLNQVCLGIGPHAATGAIIEVSGEAPGFDKWTETGTPARG